MFSDRFSDFKMCLDAIQENLVLCKFRILQIYTYYKLRYKTSVVSGSLD